MHTSRNDLKANVLHVEKAEGSGNCALHAFILACFRKEVLDQIERRAKKDMGMADGNAAMNMILHEFIQRAAAKLAVAADWYAVKHKILTLRKINKKALQRTFAQVMRDIAIECAEQNPQHMESTIEPLKCTFRNDVLEQLGIEVNGPKDDIYLQHPFIQAEFAELQGEVRQALFGGTKITFDSEIYTQLKENTARSIQEDVQFKAMDVELETALATAENKLLDWWKPATETKHEAASGYTNFLSSMKSDGQWAGDTQLAELAAYFHVNLDVIHHDNAPPHHMYIDHGVIPVSDDEFDYKLESQDISQLVVRGIVDRPEQDQHDLQLLELDRTEVDSRLSAVPECETVTEYIINSPAIPDSVPLEVGDVELSDYAAYELKGTPVPESWPQEVRQQLVQRGVIGPKNGVYSFSVGREEAIARIVKMDDKDKILAAWDAYHKESPILTLKNIGAYHWDNMLPASAPELVEPKSVPSLISETIAKIQSGEIKPSEEKWRVYLKNDTAALETEKTVEYTLPENQGVQRVTIPTQVALDERMATELQQLFYSEDVSKDTQEQLDRELAQQLQDEEDQLSRGYKKR